MKADLDRLMEERGLDAAVVSGRLYGNVSLMYMVNRVALGRGFVVKKRGEEPFLIHLSMERDEAAASGLQSIDMGRYDIGSIAHEKATRLEAQVELYRRIFADLGVQGDVGFYGDADWGASWVLLQALDEALPDIRVRGEYSEDLVSVARATKDASEMALIKEAARLTCEVIEATKDFLRRHAVKDEMVMTADGAPLTIGIVKEHIRRLLAERRLTVPEGFIFASGRDAGIGHSVGRSEELVRLGKTIVFDLFPRFAGGYFCDCTRTFCLGYAPPEVETTYADAVACADAVIATAKVGVETRELQRTTNRFLEERGYGKYPHTIGHGVGLAVHEEPLFEDTPSNTRVLQPGHVFTVEPALLYPEQDYAARVEDVVWIDPEGQARVLTDLSKELVVEMV